MPLINRIANITLVQYRISTICVIYTYFLCILFLIASPHAGSYSHRWPFLDIWFYDINSTLGMYKWENFEMEESFVKPVPTDMMFPTRRGYYHGLLLPIPAHPEILLNRLYEVTQTDDDALNLRPIKCFQGYDHQHEKHSGGSWDHPWGPDVRACTKVLSAYTTVSRLELQLTTGITTMETFGSHHVVSSTIFSNPDGSFDRQEVWIRKKKKQKTKENAL